MIKQKLAKKEEVYIYDSARKEKKKRLGEGPNPDKLQSLAFETGRSIQSHAYL